MFNAVAGVGAAWGVSPRANPPVFAARPGSSRQVRGPPSFHLTFLSYSSPSLSCPQHHHHLPGYSRPLCLPRCSPPPPFFLADTLTKPRDKLSKGQLMRKNCCPPHPPHAPNATQHFPSRVRGSHSPRPLVWGNSLGLSKGEAEDAGSLVPGATHECLFLPELLSFMQAHGGLGAGWGPWLGMELWAGIRV